MDSLRFALGKLAGLRDEAIVTEEEFEVYRRRLLAHHSAVRQQNGGGSSPATSSACTSPPCAPAPALCLSPGLPCRIPPRLAGEAAMLTPSRRSWGDEMEAEEAEEEREARSSSGESGSSCSALPSKVPFRRRSSSGAATVLCPPPAAGWPSPQSTVSESPGKPVLREGGRCGMGSLAAAAPGSSSGSDGENGATRGTFAVKMQPLPASVTTADLTRALSVFGVVDGAVVNVGKPNYGYVRFVDEASAQAAHSAGNVFIHGKKVRVRLAKWRAGNPSAEPEPSTFVGLFNLPFRTTEAWLSLFLENFPGFIEVRMMNRKGGAFAGYAFAEFRSVEEAAACRVSLGGLTLDGQSVDVKFATRPAPQDAPLQG